MAYCATNGNLYENGKAFELKVGIGADFKVHGKSRYNAAKVAEIKDRVSM